MFAGTEGGIRNEAKSRVRRLGWGYGCWGGGGGGVRGRLRNEANFPIFRLGRICCGGIVVGLVLPADSLAAFEFGEVGEEGALGFNDVTMEALEGFGIGCEAGAEIRAPFGFVGDAGGVVDEVGGEEAVAAKEPIVSDEDIDEDAFDDAEGLELAVVLGGESGEGGGVFTAGGFVSGVDAGFEGVHAGDSLALFGARTGRELRVSAISLNLFLGWHRASDSYDGSRRARGLSGCGTGSH